MFLRLVADSFTRRPRRKVLTAAALSLGMAVVTAALSVSLDVGDRLAREFLSLGANLLVPPQADSLPLEIGGVHYRPVNAGAYLPESDLGKLKTIFWRNNIVGFAPVLEFSAEIGRVQSPSANLSDRADITVIGTWSRHEVHSPDGTTYVTGIERTNPWWTIQGRWFNEGKRECVVGAALARRLTLEPGDVIYANVPDPSKMVQRFIRFSVVGVLSTGGPEDQAAVTSLPEAQELARRPREYRRLYVSALTKPEDDFGRRDPSTLAPADYD